MPKSQPTIWSRLTPLNRALALVLLVAVPFFLLLLILVLACVMGKGDVKISLREDNKDLNNYFYRSPKSRAPVNNRRYYYDQSEEDDDVLYDYPEVNPNIFRRRYVPSRRTINDDYGFERNKFEDHGVVSTSTVAAATVGSNATDLVSNATKLDRIKRDIPNGDYFYKARNGDDQCVCDDDCGPEVKVPFVVALNEITFIDDPDDEDYRYKCTGVILSDSMVLVSAECVSDPERSPSFYQIKAGTNTWSNEDASTHSIENIIRPTDNNGLVLLKLKEKLPMFKSIKRTVIETSVKTTVNLESWSWDISAIMPLQWRSKNVAISQKSVSFTECSQCAGKPCIREELTHVCSEYYYTSGNPVFYSDQVVAMQTALYCIDDFTAAKCYVKFDESISSWVQSNL